MNIEVQIFFTIYKKSRVSQNDITLEMSYPWADSGAKILVLMEISQRNHIDEGLGSPNPV